jgi:hypothetical protein
MTFNTFNMEAMAKQNRSNEIGCMCVDCIIWLWTGKDCRLLLTWELTLGCQKRREFLIGQLQSAFQGPCFMDLTQ